MLCDVNEASQCLAHSWCFKGKVSLYSVKKRVVGWKCTAQSTYKFAIHEVHKT